MALFMYPHSITGVLASKNRDVIRRNASVLPAYSLLLGLLALLGYMALAAGVKPIGLDGKTNAQLAVPQLFENMFPSWFAGIAFAAIAIGALVPAAIMSIAAANLFTRNVYRPFLRPQASPAQEARVSKSVSLLVKFGALVFVFFFDRTAAINFQLLGGIWMLQTFPAIVVGLYTRWFHRWALLVGWGVAMVYGTVVAYNQISPATGKHFGSQVAAIPGLGEKGYIALSALAVNLLVTLVLTLLLRALNVPAGADRTTPADYREPAREPGYADRIHQASGETTASIPS
jgi:SSS family solute:Na+ symporter